MNYANWSLDVEHKFGWILQGALYAGIGNQVSCYCGWSYGDHSTSTICDKACTSETSATCGGTLGWTLIDTGLSEWWWPCFFSPSVRSITWTLTSLYQAIIYPESPEGTPVIFLSCLIKRSHDRPLDFYHAYSIAQSLPCEENIFVSAKNCSRKPIREFHSDY